MKLTDALRKWLREHCEVKADAVDAIYEKAAGEALATEKLSLEEFKRLSKTEADTKAEAAGGTLKTLADAVTKLVEVSQAGAKGGDGAAADGETKTPAGDKAADKDKTKTPHRPSMLEKMVTGVHMAGGGDEPDGDKTFGVRVKEAAEQYDATKTALHYPTTTKGDRPHPLAGQRVRDYSTDGHGLDDPSDRDRAVAGAYAKFAVNAARLKSKSLAFQQLPQHDKELLCWALENEKWSGASDGGQYADIRERKLTPIEQKALIDDSTSGGLEAAPIVFDDMVIQTPLMHGELFPLVTVIPLDRGRRVEGVRTGTVTGSWGGVDDTAIDLFTTTSYVSAFDTTIFRWQGAIRIGLDFLGDTPIDFSAHVTSQYGERLLEDLDDVIATGNGTTQPEGVTVKSGTTSITFSSTTSIGNYESLRFGVAKPEHRANVAGSAVFVGNEESYQRARAIPVGSSDARRLGGMDYSSYSWMERPYKINESLTNLQIFYTILARYRMYRRRGLTMRTSTEGDTLIRANEMLITATARYGGQLERGACAAVTSDAPA